MLLPLCEESIKYGHVKQMDIEISNVNRSLGTILSNEITKVYKDKGLKSDTIIINAIGNAGNSFGAFLTNGVTLNVTGDANDYLGKGLCGGKIIVKSSKKATFAPEKNIICGNVALYGATSGEVYLDGICGERFSIRNSGAKVVALGCGLHGCEYMTGGVVVLLGKIGRNFAAGMSGGVAYIYGPMNKKNVNKELVSILDIDDKDINVIKELLQNHIKYTNSEYVSNLLYNFDPKDYFKVLPNDYAKIMNYMDEAQKLGIEDKELYAFNKFTGVK